MVPVFAGGTEAQRSRGVTRLRALACASMLALALACAAPSHALADETPIHVDLSQGFARIVFDLTQTTEAQSEQAFGVMVLRFKQPVSPDLEALRVALGPYVSLVRQDADQRTLRFALRGPVRVEQAAIGNQLAIDLIPPRYNQDPPPFNGLTVSEKGVVASDAAPAIAPLEAHDRKAIASFVRPEPLPIVAVRSGEQPTFTRIVFDWPQAVEYIVEPGIGRTVVRFSRAAQLDLSELRTNPPRYVHGARSEIVDGKVSAVIELDPNIEVRDLRDGNKIVLDLSAHASPAAPVEADGLPKDDAHAISMGFERPLPGAKGEAAKADAHENGEPDDAHAVLTGTVAARLPPRAEPDAPPPAASPETPASPAALAPEGVLSYLADGADTLIVVPFAQETAGAVFRHGDSLWMVFDNVNPLEPGVPGREVLHDLGEVSSGVEDGVRVVRAQLKNDALVDVAQEGTRWVIRLTQNRISPSQSVSIAREVSAAGRARLRFAAQAEHLHWLKDPYLGSDILVATGKLPERGLTTGQKLVELEAFASSHGVALTPYSEDLGVRLDQGDVVVEGSEGLVITASENVNRGSIHSPVERIDAPGFLDFVHWRVNKSDDDYIAARQKLMRDLAQAAQSDRAMARFALARFYAANGFGEEALGVLDYMLKDDPRIENAPAFHALRGAALFMMTRYKDAQAEFAHGSLANVGDVAPWRGAIATKLERFAAANEAFARAEGAISRYPALWQARFRLAQARAALARNDIKSAAAAMTAMPSSGLEAQEKVEADLMAGRIYEAQGKKDDALAHYRFAAKGARGAAQAEARLAAATLAQTTGALSPRDATDQLEDLRFDWRGDALELMTLARLGEIYAQDRRYREGLNTLRSAVSYFPDSEQSREISASMSEIFRKLYLEGGADAMKPVEALALYYDFRELTPIGREGDDMIRRLAERLVVVDLLPQAAELLQYQVDKRLEGAARAQVATRLAMIYLMDHKPEQSLRTIRSTRQVQLPESVQRQRRLLEARALAEVKQYDSALEVLLYDEGADAERIRADVYWKAENWPSAAEHIEALLGNRWRDSKPLEDEERFQIMRAAISYLFANDDFGLGSLKDRYGVAMKGSSDGAAFALVAQKPDTTSADFGELARRIASVDTLDAFMASFQRELGEGKGMPATN